MVASGSKASIIRIISFILAGGDIVQTIPDTIALYRKAWRKRSLNPTTCLYAMARYTTIISLVTNGIGFYGTHFTPETCKPFYMVPNVTAMLAGMAVQTLVFIRTYAISGRSLFVYFGLGAILLLGFPVQIFGIVYHRLPETTGGECKGKVFARGEPDWNIVYYSAHMAYDLIACVTGTFFLVSPSIQGTFNMTAFVRRVLRNGLLYFVVVFFSNLWVVLEFEEVMKTGVGSTLPLAIVLIAAQHLVLSTQHPFQTASIDDYSYSNSGPRPLSGGRRAHGQSLPSEALPSSRDTRDRQDFELQPGDFVVAGEYENKSGLPHPGHGQVPGVTFNGDV